jgi:peptide deformylase
MKEIVQEGALILREVADPVPENLFGSSELASIVALMEQALEYELEGVALAAPQLGFPYRLFIVRKDRTLAPTKAAETAGIADTRTSGTDELPAEPETVAPEVEIYVNPEIVKTSRRKAKMDEGCLSIRGVYGTTKRHERVTIRARREDGSRFERGGGGIMAQVFEHEVDHLNGVLFTDLAEHIIHIQHATTA